MAVLTAELPHRHLDRPGLRLCIPETASNRGPIRLSPIRPAEEAEWDRYVHARMNGTSTRSHSGEGSSTFGRSTLFHTLAWRNSVRASFCHEPVYLAARRGETEPICGILPLFLVKSVLGGRMLVSVPYGVGGGPVADDHEVRGALIEAARERAAQTQCRSLELRNEVAAAPNAPIVDGYVGFRRDLPSQVEDVLPWLPRKARAAARNGRDRFGLTVEFAGSHLRSVWRLYAMNMRRLGSICYPFRYFQALHDELTAQETHGTREPVGLWVSLVRRATDPVAGLVSFVFGDTIMPYFYGAAPIAQRCSAANYAYFTLAERAVERGLRVFDFGRTRVDNQGSFDFKRFHGFEPHPLEYQRIVIDRGMARDLTPGNPAFSLARRAWPYLPLGFTTMAGGWLSRHIPG